MSQGQAAPKLLTPNVIVNKCNDSNIFSRTLLKGMRDYFAAFPYWRVWLQLTWSEIQMRYRRTVVGPFWTTLSIGIFITSMGLIFSMLWHREAKDYIPYFSSSYISWMFISTCIIDSGKTFTSAEKLMHHMPMPYTIYACVVVARNLIVFAHHMIVFVIIMLVFHIPINLNTLLIFPALFLLAFTGSWVCILFGILVTRFRDIEQIILSILQILLFVTPIFWQASQLGTNLRAKLIIDLNPLVHYIAIIRAPLLGRAALDSDWVFVLAFCMIGWIITMIIFGKFYKHLVFWL